MSDYLIRIKLKENYNLDDVLNPLMGLFIEKIQIMTPTVISLEDNING